jgi:hypothetical protein
MLCLRFFCCIYYNDMKYLLLIFICALFGCSNKSSNLKHDYSIKQLQMNLGYSFYNNFNVIVNFDDKFIGLYSSNNTGDARDGVEFQSFVENLNDDDLHLIDSIIKEFDKEDFNVQERGFPLPDGNYFEMAFIENDEINQIIIYDYIKNKKHQQLIDEVLKLILKYNRSNQNEIILKEII